MFYRLRQFMYGRYGQYGSDQLSIALIIIGFVFSFVTMFIRVPFINLLTFIPISLFVFRTLSKNINKRRLENQQFLKIWLPLKSKFTGVKHRYKDRKTHKYFNCSGCGATLRVPKGKGRVTVTCPKCRNSFLKRT